MRQEVMCMLRYFVEIENNKHTLRKGGMLILYLQKSLFFRIVERGPSRRKERETYDSKREDSQRIL